MLFRHDWDMRPGVKLGEHGSGAVAGMIALPDSPQGPLSIAPSDCASSQATMDARLAKTFDLRGLEVEYAMSFSFHRTLSMEYRMFDCSSLLQNRLIPLL